MQRRQKLLLSFMIWGLILFYGIAVAAALTPQEIANIALGSTVHLGIIDTKANLKFGSGFVVHDGQIATNHHVIEGMLVEFAKLVGKEEVYPIEAILAVDKARDLAIVKVTGLDVPPLSLGDSDTVQIGDKVYAVGNPQGLEGSFSDGIISAIRGGRENKLFQMTAPISQGSSGGPVLNENGEVIGVSVASAASGQNLNFAIPVNYLKSMVTMRITSTPAKPREVRPGVNPTPVEPKPVKPQVNPLSVESTPVKSQVNSPKRKSSGTPSPQETLEEGINLYEQARYSEAIKVLNSAIQALEDSEQQARAYIYLGCSKWGAGESKEKVREQFQKSIRHNPDQKLPPRIGEDHPIFAELLEEVRKELTGELTVISLLPQTEIWIDGDEIDRKMLGNGIVSRRLLKGDYTVEGIYDGESKQKAIQIEPNQQKELDLEIPPTMKHKPRPKISVGEIIPLTVSLISSKAPQQVNIYYKIYDKESNELAQNSQKMRLWEKQSASSTWIYKAGLPSQKHVGLIEYYIEVAYNDQLAFRHPRARNRHYQISIVDDKPPTISLIEPPDGTKLGANQQITIRAEVTDNIAVKDVHIHFSSGDSQKLTEEDSSGIYAIDITVSNMVVLRYYLTATDDEDNESRSEARYLEIKITTDEEGNERQLESERPKIKIATDDEGNKEQPKSESVKIPQGEKLQTEDLTDEDKSKEPTNGDIPKYPPEKPRPPPISQRIWASYTWLGGFSDIPSASDLIENSMFRLTYLRGGRTHSTLGAQLDFYPDRTNVSATALWGPALGTNNIAFTLRGGVAAYKTTSTTNSWEESIHITPILGAGLKVQPVDKIAIDVAGSIQSRQGISLYHYEGGIRFYITRELSLRAGYGKLYLDDEPKTIVQMGLGVNF